MKKTLWMIVIFMLVCTLCALSVSCSKPTTTITFLVDSDIPITSDECFCFTLLENDTYEISGYEQTLPIHVNIPSIYEGKKVTTIGTSAFRDSEVKKIILPESITTIDDYAFNCCRDLVSIELPSSAASIGVGAFVGCNSLTSIKIPKGVAEIKESTFEYCNNITTITIPSSVKNIASWAFLGCNKLSYVYYEGSITDWCNVRGVVELYDTSESIPDICLYINGEKVEGKITIPDNVTRIGEFSFFNCDNVTSVIIPTSITYIERGAFAFCDSLTDFSYKGTIDQWNSIQKEEGWDSETGPYTVFCIDDSIRVSRSTHSFIN